MSGAIKLKNVLKRFVGKGAIFNGGDLPCIHVFNASLLPSSLFNSVFDLLIFIDQIILIALMTKEKKTAINTCTIDFKIVENKSSCVGEENMKHWVSVHHKLRAQLITKLRTEIINFKRESRQMSYTHS